MLYRDAKVTEYHRLCYMNAVHLSSICASKQSLVRHLVLFTFERNSQSSVIDRVHVDNYSLSIIHSGCPLSNRDERTNGESDHHT